MANELPSLLIVGKIGGTTFKLPASATNVRVDTTLGKVTLVLPKISDVVDYMINGNGNSLGYQVTVYDGSNTSAVNNITIVSDPDNKIESGSIIINKNGGSAIIALSGKSWSATSNQTVIGNREEFYLNGEAPDGGDGSQGSPFNKFSQAIAAIPQDGKTYNLYIAPFEYTEPSPVDLPNKSNLNLIGQTPSNTSLGFQLNYTADGSITAVMQIRNLALQTFKLDLALAPFASVTFLDLSMSLDRVDTNPNAIVSVQGGIFNTTISGTVLFSGCPIFGDITVEPASTLYCTNVLFLSGIIKLRGNCTLKTLGTLNPADGQVNGTIVGGNTPTWLTDAASNANFTGSVNKTVY